MKFTFSDLSLPQAGSIALPVLADRTLTKTGTDLDAKTGGILTRAMAANKFSGKADETLTIVAPGGVDLNHILLIGLGKPDQIKDSRYRMPVAPLWRRWARMRRKCPS